uniref:ribonuclease Z n=1 Tax=Chaetoceros debilis TaxID=122233 RepID=A0A7S3QJP6_9STRA
MAGESQLNDEMSKDECSKYSSKNQVQQQRLKFSLDTLTDGSEHTGHGTVFLTVSRQPSSSTFKGANNNAGGSTCGGSEHKNADMDSGDDTILARYALSGLCTLTSRLAADQNFKLSTVRAVFCASRQDVACISGIPSLLLSLSNYSTSGKLHVVGDDGIESYMDGIGDIILKRRQYPEIVSCTVPSVTNGSTCWWKVYEDDLILVFGRIIDMGGNDDDDNDDDESHQENESDDESCADDSSSDSNDGSVSTSSNAVNNAKEGECTRKSVAYIVTLRFQSFSFAILPPGMSYVKREVLTPIPDVISKQESPPFDFILHIDPNFGRKEDCASEISVRQPSERSLGRYHLYTAPNNVLSHIDDGILIRAGRQAERFNAALPFAFPFRNASIEKNETFAGCDEDDPSYMKLSSCSSVIFNVKNCNGAKDRLPSIQSRKDAIHDKISRKREGSNDDGFLKNQWANNQHLLEIFYSAEGVLKTSMSGNNQTKLSVEDENEIDLSDDDVDDDGLDISDDDCPPIAKKCKGNGLEHNPLASLDTSAPHLLVLGTGCASPAPLRGSSGNALFLPTISEYGYDLALTMIAECGEGFLTMLHRHLPQLNHGCKSIKEIISQDCQLIWISHSHLDHYGDIPVLIDEIQKFYEHSGMCKCYQRGGSSSETFSSLPAQRTNEKSNSRSACKSCRFPRLPIVVAPSKVLRFLDFTLDSKNGLKNGKRIYIGITHRDFEKSPFSKQIRSDVLDIELRRTEIANDIGSEVFPYRPFQFLKNIPVHHCPDAFGFLIGISAPCARSNEDSAFTICYSGDTRPSTNLVRACNDFSRECRQNVSLLLHEATFEHDERGQVEATKKRHSTTLEALNIASQMYVDSVLLTHFSQRYPKFPPRHPDDNIHERYSSASAYDGMLIKLTKSLKKHLSSLGSCCTVIMSDTITSKKESSLSIQSTEKPHLKK